MEITITLTFSFQNRGTTYNAHDDAARHDTQCGDQSRDTSYNEPVKLTTASLTLSLLTVPNSN